MVRTPIYDESTFELQETKQLPGIIIKKNNGAEEAACKLSLSAFEIPQMLAMTKRKSLNTVQ